MHPKEKHENNSFPNDYEVNIANENTPTVFPAHWHTYVEFVLATKDNCVYIINGTSYHMNAGDLLLIWPFEIHEIVSTPQHASIILQFDASIINQCHDINPNRYELQSHHHIVAQDRGDLAQILESCMQKSHDIFHSGEQFIETKIKIQILEMLTILATDAFHNRSLNHTALLSLGESYQKINNICLYIMENCEKDLTQENVAEYAGFSRYHFARIFKEYTATTFVHYLTKQRLQKATELLGDFSVPITSVAYQSGFQSISNFNRVFKNAKGCSPKEYRKMFFSSDSLKSQTMP